MTPEGFCLNEIRSSFIGTSFDALATPRPAGGRPAKTDSKITPKPGARGEHIFSVAQHTLLTGEVARRRAGSHDRRLALAVLLHDAPEYVIGDMISPFKVVMGGSYKEVERRLLDAIHLRFGLPADLPADVAAIIKAADLGAAFLEATALAGFSAAEARRFFGPRPALPAAAELDYLTPWPADTAKQRFLQRFNELQADTQAP